VHATPQKTETGVWMAMVIGGCPNVGVFASLALCHGVGPDKFMPIRCDMQKKSPGGTQLSTKSRKQLWYTHSSSFAQNDQ